MAGVSIPRSPLALRSKRLLALGGDERLVHEVRAGNEAAFEVVFERHGGAILGFCRHMLGSPSEAEDAVQHTFAAAYRALLEDDRPVRLRPWLFAIARNRCLSMLRARREEPAEHTEVATEGLAATVEARADLRELLADLRDLPEEQRAALLLAEVGALSHAEVAGVLGCEVQRVKALVFRARSGLIDRRDARHTPCEDIREQLANLRGGSLRRTELRHHLRVCAGCRDYRAQLKHQRGLLAAALPVTPSLGLKSSVLGALGAGGGSAGAGGTLVGGAAGLGSLASGAAKVACVAIVAGGGAIGGEAALSGPPATPTPAAQLPAVGVKPAPEQAQAATPAPTGAAERARPAGKQRRKAARAERRRDGRERRRGAAGETRARPERGARSERGPQGARGRPEGPRRGAKPGPAAPRTTQPKAGAPVRADRPVKAPSSRGGRAEPTPSPAPAIEPIAVETE